MQVKEYRKAKGYTQSEIAVALNICQGSYSDKERGRRPFTVEEILKMEILLGVTVNDMFKDRKSEIKKEMGEI